MIYHIMDMFFYWLFPYQTILLWTVLCNESKMKKNLEEVEKKIEWNEQTPLVDTKRKLKSKYV